MINAVIRMICHLVYTPEKIKMVCVCVADYKIVAQLRHEEMKCLVYNEAFINMWLKLFLIDKSALPK